MTAQAFVLGKADIIFMNGNILTVDTNNSISEFNRDFWKSDYGLRN